MADEVACLRVGRRRRWVVDSVLENRPAQKIRAEIPLRPELRTAEVAASQCVIWHRGCPEGCSILVLILLVVPEEERSVLAVINFRNKDWTANRKATVVNLPRRADMLPVTVIGKWNTRIQRLVGSVQVGAAAQLIRSAARRKIEEPAGDLSELGGKIRGL